MRYADFTKPQNKKILSLLEREDKQAGAPSNKPVVQGSVSAGVGAAAPVTVKPAVKAKGTVSGNVGVGLTKAQQVEAALVGKLPSDFPIDQWESMNTKAQLKAMQHSGLNDQEQWVLLNATAPLSVLDQHNQMMDEIAIKAYVARSLAPVYFAAMTQSGQRTQASDSKTSNSTSLQSDALRQKLDMLKEEVKKNPLGKVGGGVGATVAPKATGNVTASLGSTLTPLPKPGPTPVTTPEVNNDTTRSEKSTPIELTSRDKQMLLGLLNMDKSLLSVSDRKLVEFVERQMQRGVTTLGQLDRYYSDIMKIRNKVNKLEWVDKVKSDSTSTAQWGIGLINDQSAYSNKPGTFGRFGNLAENGCGIIAMHNANQLLGYNIPFGEFYFEMRKYNSLVANLGGSLGMNPDVIGLYNDIGADVTRYNIPNNISKDHDAYIALLVYSSGAHYVAAEYNDESDKYIVYNLYQDSEVPSTVDNLSSKDLNGYFLLTVWGIDSPSIYRAGSTDPALQENK